MYSQNQFYELKTVSETFLKKNTKPKTKKTTPNQTKKKTKQAKQNNKQCFEWGFLFGCFFGGSFLVWVVCFFFSVPAVWGGHRIHSGNP